MQNSRRVLAFLALTCLVGCAADSGDEFEERPPVTGYTVSGTLTAEDEREIVAITRTLTDDPIIKIHVHPDQVTVMTQNNKVFGFERRDGKWKNVSSGGWVS